jgi:dimethylamine monooxygenase subunit A
VPDEKQCLTLDNMKYLPFLDGKYSTAPALQPMAKAGDSKEQFVFQIDEQYDAYLANKSNCRKEDIHKYYVEAELHDDTVAAVNRQIVQQLITEYPADFTLDTDNAQIRLHNGKTGKTLQWEDDWIHIGDKAYLSLFDALCSQVQEDVAICQLDGGRDWLAAIHLSSPNHWAPALKVGRPFSSVHHVVPGMEKLNQQYFKMLVTAVQKGPFSRFAWGIATDTRLNHHPVPPPGADLVHWRGRSVQADTSNIYLRVERQTITGIPSCHAFLFTIRTYFYDTDELTAGEKSALYMAVKGMSPESLEYKGLTDKVEILRTRLLR